TRPRSPADRSGSHSSVVYLRLDCLRSRGPAPEEILLMCRLGAMPGRQYPVSARALSALCKPPQALPARTLNAAGCTKRIVIMQEMDISPGAPFLRCCFHTQATNGDFGDDHEGVSGHPDPERQGKGLVPLQA